MRVKLLTTRADQRRRYEIGDELDLPIAEAIRLIEDGQAQAAREIETEIAVGPEGERAVRQRPKSARIQQRGDIR